MVIALATKPGINGANTLSIPKDWDSTWFRKFIANSLKGADVRNAVGSGGIVVSGNIASPYATIGFGAPVTLPGPVTINAPISGTSPALTVHGTAGGFAIVANDRSTTDDMAGHFDIASSNGDYPRVGYNLQSTTSVGVYDYIVSDFSSAIAFVSGGLQFLTAPSGTAGNPITYSTVFQLTQAGAVGFHGASPVGQTTGFGTPTGNVVIANFPGATATLVQTSETVAEILVILKGLGLIGA
jgi:hypothetical protein